MFRKLAIAVVLFDVATSDLWEDFKDRFKHRYEPGEEPYRRRVFLERVKDISENNLRHDLGAGNQPMAMSGYEDMTSDEFADRLTLHLNSSDYTSTNAPDCSGLISTKVSFQAWELYKKKYKKSYNVTEEYHRKKNFEKRVAEMIDNNVRHMLGLARSEDGLNHFSDMTYDELYDQYGMKINFSQIDISDIVMHEVSNLALPEEMDWRKFGVVTGVKNQGSCNSCYAFASAAAVEALSALNGALMEFSEQQIVDCSLPFGNHGCPGGGFLESSFRYLIQNGVCLEHDYPYVDRNQSCLPCAPEFAFGSFKRIEQGNEFALQDAVATVGPVAVYLNYFPTLHSLQPDTLYWDDNCESVVQPQTCSLGEKVQPSSRENSGFEPAYHTVLVVGYGTHHTGRDYWLVKNSWGKNWADGGFGMIPRNRNNYCGIASRAFYPVM